MKAKNLSFINLLTGQTITPQPWQANLKVGDYYAIETPTAAVGEPGNFETFDDLPIVYGHIESDEECQPGFFWARGYSHWCPDGELGLLNICEPTRQLTAEEFDTARLAGWPVTVPPSPSGRGEGGEGR